MDTDNLSSPRPVSPGFALAGVQPGGPAGRSTFTPAELAERAAALAAWLRADLPAEALAVLALRLRNEAPATVAAAVTMAAPKLPDTEGGYSAGRGLRSL